MSYYTLPKITANIYPHNLKVEFKAKNDIYISKTFSTYLNQVKKKISLHFYRWDNVKKYTNPFEYIHTTYPGGKNPVSKLKPLSRAFFKFIEIAGVFDIFEKFNNRKINTFHLAEGPGGFIEATQLLRMDSNDKYYGMTLIDENNKNIPGWKKSQLFLDKHPNIHIEKGTDNTGDMYNPLNFKYCVEKYKNSMDIITGDGGFDFSVDFNKQEELAFRLILSQVAYAIAMQKKGGHFILKYFDSFMKSSVDILYILSSLYNEVHIYKPQTSRYANSEKYIICMDFKCTDTTGLSKKFYNIISVLNTNVLENTNISTIFNVPINHKFKMKITEINAILGQQQIDNILTTLRFIENKERKNEKLQNLSTKNIQKCVNWCIKYKIPYYKNMSTGNIFLSKNKTYNNFVK